MAFSFIQKWWANKKKKNKNTDFIFYFILLLGEISLRILLYPAILLLGIYPEKKNSNVKKYMHPNVHSSTICNNTETQKHPKCPLKDEWIKNMSCSHTQWNTTQPYKEWNNAICSNMDEPRDYHTKWNQTKTKTIWYHLYVESVQVWGMKRGAGTT